MLLEAVMATSRAEFRMPFAELGLSCLALSSIRATYEAVKWARPISLLSLQTIFRDSA
jgi:hypothetical protein